MEGERVCFAVGVTVGFFDGIDVGSVLGLTVGVTVGYFDGIDVGIALGFAPTFLLVRPH